nr:integrase, catalytic region, zinc finger, CCHC-type, peptidase aspartic, catalytic [Tanacetum cinerariifolium]
MNKFKKVTFIESIASFSTNQETHDSIKPMLHSTGVKCYTSAIGSKPSGNTKNNRVSQPSSSNKINKVEDQPRRVKTRKNNKNRVKKVKCDDHVMQSMSNANCVSVSINNAPVKNSMNDVKSGYLCAICGKCMIAETHHACVYLVMAKINESQKSKSTKKHKKQNIWKPTGHVFTKVGLKWKPTGRTFTIVGNSCPLTRFTSTNIVPPKQTTFHSVEKQKPEIKVYSRKPKNVKNIGSSKMVKIVESKSANHLEPNHTWGSIATDIPSSSSLVMTDCPDCTLRQRLRAGYDTDDYLISTSTKDEAPAAIIKCIKNIQVRLNATVQNVRTDNGTEFAHQTLREFYENVGISHQTSVARTPHSGPELNVMTPATPSTGLVSDPVSQQPCIPPNRDDWDRLFQPMFEEYFNPLTIVVSPVQEAAAPRAEVLADSPVSIFISQDAPSISSSSNVIQIHTPFEHLGRWTKDHPIANVVGDPSRFVSTRKQLETDAMWYYFDAFLTSVEPKNFKQAMTKPSWIDAMQEEIHEFERLEI